jgi:hypothetical protein
MSGLKNHHQRALNQAASAEGDRRREVMRALEALGVPEEMLSAATDAVRGRGWEAQSCQNKVMFVR